MKQLRQLKNIMGVLMFGVAVVASSASSAYATSLPPGSNKQQVSGPQAKAPIEPGTQDAKAMEKLGPTDQLKTNAKGEIKDSVGGATPLAGNVAGVDFETFYNYCYRNLVYTTVRNTTSTIKYVQVKVWNQGHYRELSTSIAAGGTYSYPAFYGVDGAYSAYLYVWNGSSYVYDEYKGGTNTCNVAVSRVYNSAGWAQLKIQNVGTAYATQISSELAPYSGSGTYTGTHYDYPVAGGAAIYRWFSVGTLPYGITSYTSGSWNTPYFFTGDL